MLTWGWICRSRKRSKPDLLPLQKQQQKHLSCFPFQGISLLRFFFPLSGLSKVRLPDRDGKNWNLKEPQSTRNLGKKVRLRQRGCGVSEKYKKIECSIQNTYGHYLYSTCITAGKSTNYCCYDISLNFPKLWLNLSTVKPYMITLNLHGTNHGYQV